MKSLLFINLSVLWCCICACLTFLFCSRVIFLQKVEKLDPIHVIKKSKNITALSKIKQEEFINKLLENG